MGTREVTIRSETPQATTRYVIVAHGIGQQRKNETVLPVIHRFAEARAVSAQHTGQPITRGVLASHLRESQSGDLTWGLEEGWVEFDGISQDPDARRFVPFVGRRTSRPGANLRFVDMHWAGVMDGQFATFGEPTPVWTRALIDRLESRNAPRWILEQLHTLRRGLLPLEQLLGSRLPGVSDEIFSRFLGDIQLYGEYLGTRGMAVRRFHERMAGLEASHELDSRPSYTVIGHSLGSIMSFDALMFAHMLSPATPDAKRRTLEVLPEYQRDPNDPGAPDSYPDLGWIANVDSFVTLGSPIDKFLLLWWLNYEHLVAPGDGWLDPEKLRPAGERIRHFNYCDAQDPVGHELDVAYSPGSAANRVFERVEDKVFTRYSLPGVAHVDYWHDRDLFGRILDLAIDVRPENESHKVVWFRPVVYLKALFFSYLAVPVAGWAVASVLAAWTLIKADSWPGLVSGLFVSAGVLLGAGWLMKLVIEWREVLNQKQAAVASRLSARERAWRLAGKALFRVFLVLSPMAWAWLAVRSWPTEETSRGEFFRDWAEALRLGDSGPQLELAVATAAAIGLALAGWRLVVWLWVQLRWGKWRDLLRGRSTRQRLEVDFETYLDLDPTRPDPIDGSAAGGGW